MAAKSAFCYKNLVLLLRNFRSHFAQCMGVLLKLPDICDQNFEIFCFRYLMSKSLNSPCNPPIIGFLSPQIRTKGCITSYIQFVIFLMNVISRELVPNVIWELVLRDASFVQFWEGSKIQSTCSNFHIYFCFLILFISSQSNSEDFSSEDERLGSLSLGVKKVG